jgi:DNA-3-methyladenine glycosylase I
VHFLLSDLIRGDASFWYGRHVAAAWRVVDLEQIARFRVQTIFNQADHATTRGIADEVADEVGLVRLVLDFGAMKGAKRCSWPGDLELMIRYHDTEWGAPLHDDRKHFEFLVLDAAQAGLSWRTILLKRENYRKAFDGFDPEKVARYSDKRVEKLLQDPGIVRNRLKVRSAVTNARCFLEIQKEFGSFDAFIWRFVNGRPIVNRCRTSSDIPARSEASDAMSKELKKRGFTFVGSTICYAYMQAAGLVNDHLLKCFRRAELR